jgi:hypothetical protein
MKNNPNTFWMQRSAKLLSATALALLIGVGAALAEAGSEARNTDRQLEKDRDARELTPVKPVRHVGPEWPPSQGQAQEQSANEKKDTKAAPSTTGQAPREDVKEKEPAKPDAAKQDAAKQDAAKPAAAPTAVQNAPQQAQTNNPAPQQAQTTAPAPPAAQSQPQPSGATQASAPNQDHRDEGVASIRLGTDASGKVAINDDQERQIRGALRRARPAELNVAVRVGDTVPQNVRLGAVTAELVDVLPQFRGYSYFVTRDEVFIVDPGKNRVVALLPVKLTATASQSPAPVRSAPAREASRPAARTATQSTRSAATATTTTTVQRSATTGTGRVEEVVIEPDGTTTTYIRAPRVYRSAPPFGRSRVYDIDME